MAGIVKAGREFAEGYPTIPCVAVRNSQRKSVKKSFLSFLVLMYEAEEFAGSTTSLAMSLAPRANAATLTRCRKHPRRGIHSHRQVVRVPLSFLVGWDGSFDFGKNFAVGGTVGFEARQRHGSDRKNTARV